MTTPAITEPELADIAAKAGAATPGPWRPSELVRDGSGPTSDWFQRLPPDLHVVDSHGTAFAFGVNVAAMRGPHVETPAEPECGADCDDCAATYGEGWVCCVPSGVCVVDDPIAGCSE